jgi:hypothetical protein
MTEPESYPSFGDDNATPSPPPRVTTIVFGTALIAVDQVRGGVRSARSRASNAAIDFLRKTRDRTDATRTRIQAAVNEADRRGREGTDARKADANGLLDATISTTIGWVQVKIVPQLIDGLMPYLISDVMPRIIDGALPDIKSRVIPVIIDDMTNDPQIRELILAQSRGVLGQVTEQVRSGTSRADDRFEAAAHRVFSRTDKGGNDAKNTHDSRNS